jgi:hypothetical protein
MRMTKKDVTGRDGYIIAKALAYAISVIDALPQGRQEGSDREDMARLLAAMRSNHLMGGARAHLGLNVLFDDVESEAGSRQAVVERLADLLSVSVRFDT